MESSSTRLSAAPGVGLRAAHVEEVLGRRPVSVSWKSTRKTMDTDLPVLDVLVCEAARAEQLADRLQGRHHVVTA